MANILVVDDDRNIRRMIVATLEPAGHRVTEADSAEQALAILARGGVELLVSDVRMAGMDGFKLLAEVKRTSPEIAGDHDDRVQLDSRRGRGDAPRRERLRSQAV